MYKHYQQHFVHVPDHSCRDVHGMLGVQEHEPCNIDNTGRIQYSCSWVSPRVQVDGVSTMTDLVAIIVLWPGRKAKASLNDTAKLKTSIKL